MTLSLHRRRAGVRSGRRSAGLLASLAAVDDDPVLLCGDDTDPTRCDCCAPLP